MLESESKSSPIALAHLALPQGGFYHSYISLLHQSKQWVREKQQASNQLEWQQAFSNTLDLVDAVEDGNGPEPFDGHAVIQCRSRMMQRLLESGLAAGFIDSKQYDWFKAHYRSFRTGFLQPEIHAFTQELLRSESQGGASISPQMQAEFQAYGKQVKEFRDKIDQNFLSVKQRELFWAAIYAMESDLAPCIDLFAMREARKKRKHAAVAMVTSLLFAGLLSASAAVIAKKIQARLRHAAASRVSDAA
jgi:hypothetical protein